MDFSRPRQQQGFVVHFVVLCTACVALILLALAFMSRVDFGGGKETREGTTMPAALSQARQVDSPELAAPGAAEGLMPKGGAQNMAVFDLGQGSGGKGVLGIPASAQVEEPTASGKGWVGMGQKEREKAWMEKFLSSDAKESTPQEQEPTPKTELEELRSRHEREREKSATLEAAARARESALRAELANSQARVARLEELVAQAKVREGQELARVALQRAGLEPSLTRTSSQESADQARVFSAPGWAWALAGCGALVGCCALARAMLARQGLGAKP
jgi:hypothetical protein